MNTLRHWAPRLFYGVYRWLGVAGALLMALNAYLGRWGDVVIDAVILLAWLGYMRPRDNGGTP